MNGDERQWFGAKKIKAKKHTQRRMIYYARATLTMPVAIIWELMAARLSLR